MRGFRSCDLCFFVLTHYIYTLPVENAILRVVSIGFEGKAAIMVEKILNKAIWVILLGLILIMSQEFIEKLIRSGGTLTVITDNVPPNTVKFRWEGPIQPPMQQKIYEAYREWGQKKKKIILSLDSNGGLVSYGGDVIKMLRKIKKTNILETQVGYGDKCLSMCVPIYLQGAIRTASKRSVWMFHKVKQVEVVSDEVVTSNPSDISKWTKQIIDRYFRPAKVSEAWINDMELRIRNKDYWSSGVKLFQEKSNIMHRLY